MLTENEQQALDIDWFFIAGDKIGFVASGGGKLPNSVALSSENISKISSFFRSLPEITDVLLNEELTGIKKTSVTESYLRDFVFMAKKGLYSFDKTLLNNFSDNNYHLVAKPIRFLALNEIPLEILHLIKESVYDGDIGNQTAIKSDNII